MRVVSELGRERVMNLGGAGTGEALWTPPNLTCTIVTWILSSTPTFFWPLPCKRRKERASSSLRPTQRCWRPSSCRMIGNALSAMVKRRRLTGSQALKAEKAVRQIPVRLVSTNIAEALKLAAEHDIYAYDAYFMRCSQALSFYVFPPVRGILEHVVTHV